MTTANTTLIDALRTTASRIAGGARYSWTHQGACNCGQLAQTLTARSPAELHAIALQRAGDWAEHAVDYCPASGYPIDHVLTTMLRAGLTTDDIVHLERLSDPKILARLAVGERALDYRDPGDVVRYLRAWAALLAEALGQPAAAA